MRIFVYKFLIIVTGIFILYHSTVAYTVFKFKQKFFILKHSGSVSFKEKIREELSKGLEKEKLFNKDDRVLIKKLYNKISSELRSSD
jgi:hypothetical protein